MLPSSTQICFLPNEMLSKIFFFLTSRTVLTTVVDVCKRWRSVVELEVQFWKNLQLVINCDDFLNTSCLDKLSMTPYEQTVKSKSFHDPIYIGERDLPKVSKVRSIKLTNGTKAKSYPALLIIRILDVTRKVCKDIETVESSQCFGATSTHFVKFLSDSYKNLHEIIFGINSVYRIPYEEFSSFKNLNTVITHDYTFKRSDLYCLADNCHQLTSLWIIFSRAVTDDDIIYFLEKKKQNLKELGVGYCLNDNVLAKLKECQFLKVLFIGDGRYISHNGLNHLTNLPLLKYISIHRAKFSVEVLQFWITLSTIPAHLNILDLTDYYLKEDEARLKIILQIGKKCPVTFCNKVNAAIARPSPSVNPHVHWMYYRVM